jgi:hypothetical protein
MVMWRWEFIVMAIEGLSAILPKMILATQGDETERWDSRPYLEDRVVGISEGVFWYMKYIISKM